MSFLAALQDSAFTTWIRESDWAIFAFLIVHTVAMGFLAGTGLALALRLLGAARDVPLALLVRFFPLMSYAVIAAICSGVLLVIGYPAKALTNPLFYLKLALVTAAWFATRSLGRRVAGVPPDPAVASSVRLLAIASMMLWLGGITAGKFLEYTHKVLLIY